MPVRKEEILSEIRRFVASNDEIPGERAFESATRIRPSSWKGRFWVRWTDAVREAGFDPNALQRRIPDDELLGKLADFVSSLDHFPVRDEVNLHARGNSGFPVWQTFKKRFGGMPEVAASLLVFAQKTGHNKVAKLCEQRIEIQERKPAQTDQTDRSTPDDLHGFVYLKFSPSLRLYKIGKAKDPNKRGVGISLLLPHDLIAKHEIRTDCPFILEKYWELRFKTKKKQGEWYDLNSKDVETFKSRREFMFREYFP